MLASESGERRATSADVFAARGPRHRSGRQRTGPLAQRTATHGPTSQWPQAPACRSDRAGKIILGTALAVAAALVLAVIAGIAVTVLTPAGTAPHAVEAAGRLAHAAAYGRMR